MVCFIFEHYTDAIKRTFAPVANAISNRPKKTRHIYKTKLSKGKSYIFIVDSMVIYDSEIIL